MVWQLKQIAFALALLHQLSWCAKPYRDESGLFCFTQERDTFGMNDVVAVDTRQDVGSGDTRIQRVKLNPSNNRMRIPSRPVDAASFHSKKGVTAVYSDPLPRRQSLVSLERRSLSRSLPIDIPGTDANSPRPRPEPSSVTYGGFVFGEPVDSLIGGNAMHDFHTSLLFPKPLDTRYS